MQRFLLVLSLCFLHSLNSYSQISLVPFASGFNDPVDIKHCGDERLFVVEQRGYIYIVDTNGVRLNTPFLNIQPSVRFGSEQGLLGLAFPSDYKESGYFYVNYTAQTRGNTVISRFRVSPLDSNVADPLSEERLMEIWQPYSNHNGGHLAFGPDGYLYIGTGDGGSANDPGDRSQNRDSLLGKMLRIKVDPLKPGYEIPNGNPFVCPSQSGRHEIWAVGLRNPWRFSFDRCTGDMWTGDVGQGSLEEIDFQPASDRGGLNYGWRCFEGTNVFNTSGICPPTPTHTPPVAEYNHSGGRCSVTGGYVYRGARYNNMFGTYFYTDYCVPTMYTVTRNSSGGFINNTLGNIGGSSFSSFGEDKWGELYAASLSGTIFRFSSTDCTPVASINCGADSVSDCNTGITKLSVPAGRGFTYQWSHDGILLPDTMNEILAALPGIYSVNVTGISGCSNTDSILVYTASPFSVTFSNLDTLYCLTDNPVALMPSVPGGVFEGNGMSCITFDPVAAGEGTHVITYEYRNSDGCVYMASQSVRVDACLGLQKNLSSEHLSIYPNPGNGVFTLEIRSESASSMNLEITDIRGRSVQSMKMDVSKGLNKFPLVLNSTSAGMYFAVISADSGKATLRFVKN